MAPPQHMLLPGHRAGLQKSLAMLAAQLADIAGGGGGLGIAGGGGAGSFHAYAPDGAHMGVIRSVG